MSTIATGKLTEQLPADIAMAIFPGKPQNRTYAEAIVETMFRRAITKGDPTALREIWDRTEGRVKEVISIPDPIRQELNVKSNSESDADRIAAIVGALIEAGVLAKGQNFEGTDPPPDKVYSA